MPVVAREPAAPLRPYVRRYYGFREDAPTPIRRREGPGTDVVVILSFGPEWRIGTAPEPSRPFARRTSFAAGLHEAAVLTEHDGCSYGMQVSLTPPGAHALFGVPMHELAGETVPLDAVLGEAADRLVDDLANLADWDDRFRLLEAALALRLERARPMCPDVVWAWNRLIQRHGRIAVGALADELGWSRKRLTARFRQHVGLSPKSFARLLRFERAKALLEDGRLDLAQLAFVCGYYDQAHLTHEVRRITGTTPAAYRAAVRAETNLQDALPQRS